MESDSSRRHRLCSPDNSFNPDAARPIISRPKPYPKVNLSCPLKLLCPLQVEEGGFLAVTAEDPDDTGDTGSEMWILGLLLVVLMVLYIGFKLHFHDPLAAQQNDILKGLDVSESMSKLHDEA